MCIKAGHYVCQKIKYSDLPPSFSKRYLGVKDLRLSKQFCHVFPIETDHCAMREVKKRDCKLDTFLHRKYIKAAGKYIPGLITLHERASLRISKFDLICIH